VSRTTVEESADYLPRWVHYLIEQIDRFVVRRPKGRVPALLLMREPSPETPGSADATADGAVSRLITEYLERLTDTDRQSHGGRRSLVPHALIDDTTAVAGDRAEPHIDVVERVAEQFVRTMPHGSGRLRLSRFDLCRAVLDTSAGAGSSAAKERTLRDELYKRLARHPSWLADLSKALPDMIPDITVPVDRVWLWVYGIWLDRGRRFRFVRDQLQISSTGFLNAALDLTREGAARRDPVLVQRVLLTALLLDLADIGTPGRLSVRRPRRQWSFVLLIASVGDPGTVPRTFLDTFAIVSSTIAATPVLLLGALTGDIPSYAVEIQADQSTHNPTGVADQVYGLYTDPPSGRTAENVFVVPLSHRPDDGVSRSWLAANRKVAPRPNRRRDRLRPFAPVIALALVAAAVFLGMVHSRGVPSCTRVATGERVGVTDGVQCSLASGAYAGQIRTLESAVAKQNAKVDTSRPYRSIVFFAPLSVGDRSQQAVPTGIQILRGAITQQAQLNQQILKSQMPVRLLIANAGEYFTYGSRNSGNTSGPDVAQEIIDRVHSDHIAAVVGITQSRPDSLQAVRELDSAQIPVIGTSVTGSVMVGPDSPSRYFQVSPPDVRVAAVMASFVAHSPQVRALTGATGTAPAAVLVYDPSDTYFSTDLAQRFTALYSPHGRVLTVPYSEQSNGQDSSNVADQICAQVRASHGVIVYAGRSGVMPDLFHYLQSSSTCQTRNRIPVIAESPDPDLIADPEQTESGYPFLNLFYVAFNAPAPGDLFTSQFGAEFTGLSADADAAEGYDAVGILSGVLDSVLGNYPRADFSSNDVYSWLQSTGVSNYLGESGLISLGKDQKYPANKATYVRQLQPDGSVTTPMVCGVLPDQEDRSAWGTGKDRFACPVDQ
jgi:hypothetical protein